eukprot:2750732-Pleurochrysis_carterae.AAC.2
MHARQRACAYTCVPACAHSRVHVTRMFIRPRRLYTRTHAQAHLRQLSVCKYPLRGVSSLVLLLAVASRLQNAANAALAAATAGGAARVYRGGWQHPVGGGPRHLQEARREPLQERRGAVATRTFTRRSPPVLSRPKHPQAPFLSPKRTPTSALTRAHVHARTRIARTRAHTHTSSRPLAAASVQLGLELSPAPCIFNKLRRATYILHKRVRFYSKSSSAAIRTSLFSLQSYLTAGDRLSIAAVPQERFATHQTLEHARARSLRAFPAAHVDPSRSAQARACNVRTTVHARVPASTPRSTGTHSGNCP